MSTPTGSSFLYTYQTDTTLIDSAVSSSGQKYDFTYDSYGNATGVTVSGKKYETSVTADTIYCFRNRYSGNAFAINSDSDSTAENRSYTEGMLQTWVLEAVDTANNIYRIKNETHGTSDEKSFSVIPMTI